MKPGWILGHIIVVVKNNGNPIVVLLLAGFLMTVMSYFIIHL